MFDQTFKMVGTEKIHRRNIEISLGFYFQGGYYFIEEFFSAIFNIGYAHIVPKGQPKIRKIEPCTAPEKMQEMRQFLQHLCYIQVNHIYFAIIARESPKFVRFNFSRRISIGRTVLIPKHTDFFLNLWYYVPLHT